MEKKQLIEFKMLLNNFKKRDILFYYFIIISFTSNLLFGIIFKPVIMGDASVYITLALSFLGENAEYLNHANRSPMYPILIVPFIYIFGIALFTKVVVIFQYFLVFLSSIIIYKTFSLAFNNSKVAFITGLIFIYNFSTISYAYNILSEILTVFALLLSIYFYFLFYKKNHSKYLVLSGTSAALMILSRFNLTLLPVVFVIGMILKFFLGRENQLRYKDLVKKIMAYSFPIILILNLWSFRNYLAFDEYFLIPSSHVGKRFIVGSLLTENTRVKKENEAILKIWSDAKEKYILESMESSIPKEYSFLKFNDQLEFFFIDITSGWLVYKYAKESLLDYYEISEENKNIDDILFSKMESFYDDVYSSESERLLLIRFFSLFNTFKYSIPITYKNLATLPSFVFLFYKIFYLIAMVLFVVFTLFKIPKLINKQYIINNYFYVVLLAIIGYIASVNFYAVTYADANRFKFPVEPLILGLFVYYIYEYWSYLKSKKILNRLKS